MNVRNCRKCGKVFNYVSGPRLCPRCKEAQEEDFQRVKAYVRENAGATINEVAEECEVEVSMIHQWLREERLQLTEGSSITLQCESCGAPILSGRYCEKCKRDLANDFKGAFAPKKEEPPISLKKNKDGDKMRFLNK